MPKEKTNIKQYCLLDDERDSLYEALSRVKYDSAGSSNSFVRSANRAFSTAATSETADVLHEFKNDVRASGVLVIQNNPFDRSVQKGLIEGEVADEVKTIWLSEAFLVGVVAQIGEPYSIHQEEPALVNNLCPSQKHLTQYTGLGSRVPLGLHIENAAARILSGDRSPDGLALTGVSKEPYEGPPTVVADGRLALSLCDPKVEQELWKPNFSIRFPNRWAANGSADNALRTRALAGPRENPSFVAAFYDNILRALTPRARRALEEFSDALESIATEVYIEPGLTVL